MIALENFSTKFDCRFNKFITSNNDDPTVYGAGDTEGESELDYHKVTASIRDQRVIDNTLYLMSIERNRFVAMESR